MSKWGCAVLPSWVLRLTPERAVQVRALAGDIVLCSWARHVNVTVPLSTQGWGGGVHPEKFGGCRNTPSHLNHDNLRHGGRQLAHMQTLPFTSLRVQKVSMHCLIVRMSTA